MIARPLTRRAAVAGGLLGATVLSGCSVSDLTTRKVVDPQAADRARLERARDLSAQLLVDIQAATRDPRPDPTFAALHARQIAQFTQSARLKAQASHPVTAPSAVPVTATTLRGREQSLAQSFRGLALQAEGGDVAALLASAAAGIDQALIR